MKRWWIVVVLLFSVGINVGILATLAVNRATRSTVPPVEHVSPDDPGRSRERPQPELPRPQMPQLERIADHLGLEGEDRERFSAIQRTFFREVAEQRRVMEEARRALKRELVSEAPDRARAEQLMERSASAHAALERALVVNVLESREILGPDQERLFAIFIERIARGPGERSGPPNARALRRGERPFGAQNRPPNRQGDRVQDRRGEPRRNRP